MQTEKERRLKIVNYEIVKLEASDAFNDRKHPEFGTIDKYWCELLNEKYILQMEIKRDD